jgi:pyrroline-5-carboxylate reductase
MNIRFIGGGAMASALIGGMVAELPDASGVTVIDPSEAQRLRLTENFDKIHVFESWDAAPRLSPDDCDFVVLAVKPNQVAAALAPLKNDIAALPGLLSIAAGVRVNTLSKLLDGYTNIIRAMPNTPVMVGLGVTGLYPQPAATALLRQHVNQLLENVSVLLWLDDEAQIDVITATTGSGPAYFFYMMEKFQNAVIELGVTEDIARKMAMRLTTGAAEMARRETIPFAELRANVTSKGGTTAAAIACFDRYNLQQAFDEALDAAYVRAKEIGDEIDEAINNC